MAKEAPLVLSDLSKPEPDLAVIRGRAEDDLERDVTARDVGLLVEIADSSLRLDQEEMKPIYAASGIPFSWIVNLVDDRLEVDSDPEGRESRTSEVFARGQEDPLILEGSEVGRIRVADLLP